MSSFEIGDYIAEGTMIGTIGGSGSGSENKYVPHLHYELIIDGEHTNPVIDYQHLIDPQLLITPLHMGTLSPSIIEEQGKTLKIELPKIQVMSNQKQILRYENR